MKFAEKLNIQRKKNNLSQEQLAEKVGVSRQAVSKWEIGTSYPDMEKIIQLCNILNCNLEDLLEDGLLGETKTKEGVNNFNKYVESFYKFITTVTNMLSVMSIKEILKLIFEVLILMFIFVIFGKIVTGLIMEIFQNILLILPLNIRVIILDIINIILKVIVIIISFLINLHIFKIRYLDYYVTIFDKNIETKQVEKPIEDNITREQNINKKERVIIRDKDSSLSKIFNPIFNLIKFFIKMILSSVLLTFVLMMVSLIVIIGFIISIIKYNIIFIYFIIICLALIMIIIILIKAIYNFIFNLKINFQDIFYGLLSSVIIFSLSLGIFAFKFSNFTFDNKDIKLETTNETKEISINNIDDIRTNVLNVSYIIDETLTDKIKVEIIKVKNTNYRIYYNKYDNQLVIHDYQGTNNFNFILTNKDFLENLKNNNIINLNRFLEVEVKIYTSSKNRTLFN